VWKRRIYLLSYSLFYVSLCVIAYAASRLLYGEKVKRQQTIMNLVKNVPCSVNVNGEWSGSGLSAEDARALGLSQRDLALYAYESKQRIRRALQSGELPLRAGVAEKKEATTAQAASQEEKVQEQQRSLFNTIFSRREQPLTSAAYTNYASSRAVQQPVPIAQQQGLVEHIREMDHVFNQFNFPSEAQEKEYVLLPGDLPTDETRQTEEEAQKSLKELGLNQFDVDMCSGEMRKWIAARISTLLEQCDVINQYFAKNGLSAYDCYHNLNDPITSAHKVPANFRFSEIQYEEPPVLRNVIYELRKISQQDPERVAFFTNRLIMESYLNVPMSERRYVIKRLQELQTDRLMLSYKFNAGSDYNDVKWVECGLPTDAEIVVHIVKKFFDFFLPRVHFGHQFSSNCYMDKSLDKRPWSLPERGLYLIRGKEYPPHFCVCSDGKLYECNPGNENLFNALVVFFTIAKRRDGTLCNYDIESTGILSVVN